MIKLHDTGSYLAPSAGHDTDVLSSVKRSGNIQELWNRLFDVHHQVRCSTLSRSTNITPQETNC